MGTIGSLKPECSRRHDGKNCSAPSCRKGTAAKCSDRRMRTHHHSAYVTIRAPVIEVVSHEYFCTSPMPHQTSCHTTPFRKTEMGWYVRRASKRFSGSMCPTAKWWTTSFEIVSATGTPVMRSVLVSPRQITTRYVGTHREGPDSNNTTKPKLRQVTAAR